MFKPFVEENIFDRIISDVVAKDDEHGLELRSSGGRSRSGHRYYIHGGDLGKNERCPSIKADTVADAIEKANAWLMQKKRKSEDKRVLIYKIELDHPVTDRDIENKIGRDGFIKLLQSHGWCDLTYDANAKVVFDYERFAHGNVIIWKATRK